MKCPKCKKGEIQGDSFFKEKWISTKTERISKYYCPNCDFETEFKMEMEWPDYYSIISEKREDFTENPSDVKIGGILIKPIRKQPADKLRN